MNESVLEQLEKLRHRVKRFKAKSLMENHLRQLASEWLEYKGYFVWRNVKVGTA